MDTDNPFDFFPETIDALNSTSSQMYDIWYNLLAEYQFSFSLEEKQWMLDKIMKDITEMNERAVQ